MGNFRRDNRSGGRRDYGQRDFRKRDFGDRGRDKQMHKAVCSNCGKDCEVPFKPTGDKPVFCSECFEKRNRDSDSRSFGDRGKRPDFKSDNRLQYNVQLDAINAKLDKILRILTPVTPTEEVKKEKPVIEEETPNVKKKAKIIEKKKDITKKTSSKKKK